MLNATSLLTFALVLLLATPAARAAAAHDTLGECYDHVVTQFNDSGADDWMASNGAWTIATKPMRKWSP